jgi:hypothetical protein
LLVAYFLEMGLVLTVAPWTLFWERNYFLGTWPALRPLFLSPWLRGAVSAIGLVTISAGLLDLVGLMLRPRSTHSESASSAG